jgi:uncharacterized membrane protein YadS
MVEAAVFRPEERSVRVARWVGVGGFACCAVIAVLALVGVLDPDSSSPLVDFAVTVLIGVAFLVVMCGAAGLEARRRVTIRADGVEIVGWWGSHSVELAQVTAFGIKDEGRQTQRAVLWTKDGRCYRCFAPLTKGKGLDVHPMNEALAQLR